MSQIISISLPTKHLEGLKSYYEEELGKEVSLEKAVEHAREDAKLFLIERSEKGKKADQV